MSARLGAFTALFFFIGPGTVAGLVPYWLTRWEAHNWYAATIPARTAGAALLVLGLAALAACFRRFVVEGRGTPAPIRPPATLVVHGLYRRVRNPMYVALLMIVTGQALLLGRFILLGYAAVLWLAFHLFVVLYEEPRLRRSFGAAYDEYRSRVRRWWPTLILGVAMLCACVAPADAAAIKVLSGNGARAAVAELCAQFERATGHTVTVEFAVNPEQQRRIEAGEAFDVAILNPPVLDALIRQGRILAGPRAVLGRAGIGVAARAGAPTPDISTVAAFTRTLLEARSVAYPGDGASGRYFVTVVDRLGIAPQMASKMRPMPGEYNVEVVATGEVDLVVVVASRISGVRGVRFVGLIPQELQTWIGFTAGVGAGAREPEAARALLRFLTAPAAAAVLRAAGIEPFVE